MDRKKIAIRVATLIVFLSIPTLITLATVVEYSVPDTLRIVSLEGTAELRAGHKLIRLVSDDSGEGFRLVPGQTLVLQPGSKATLSLQLLDATLSVRGPITLGLIQASRTATLPGHVEAFPKRFSARYTLTLSMENGRVEFIGTNNRTLANARITIRLPDHTFVPDTSCWRVDSSSSGQYLARSIDCPAP